MWHTRIDRIYVINLKSRPDRLEQAQRELFKYDIPFEIFTAKKHANGADGLHYTMKELFTSSQNMDNILVLEDDIEIVSGINDIMPQALRELPTNFDLLYLGANVQAPLIPAGEFLFKCNSLLTTHAVLYSSKARTLLLNDMVTCGIKQIKAWREPIDQLYQRVLQVHNNCYITNPMIVMQRSGFSDILNMDTHYSELLMENFKKYSNG